MGAMGVAIFAANLEKVEASTDLFDLIEWHYFVIALLGPGKASLDHLIAKKLGDPVTPLADLLPLR